jgi:hypothetical protein
MKKDQYTMEEVAAALGCSYQNVGYTEIKAIAKLKKGLKKVGVKETDFVEFVRMGGFEDVMRDYRKTGYGLLK